ncbi:TRAP transporter small permease [Pelagibacterium montanilacus]|uniref:TRAP transporter small permease n=1 Tax=Pelagibacterium montanilacus TaxID=2185280 RepID=UPI000F8D46FA|nr:TRAP transporter small permease [Pelagibacterium montanilacus]
MSDPIENQDDESHAHKPSPLERVVEVIVVPLMLAIVAIGFAGVVMRFFMGGRYALFWTEEVIRYGFIWLFWLCAPVLVWRGSMFAVDLFIMALPERARTVLRIFHCLAILVLVGPYIHYGWAMAQVNGRQLSSALQFPLFWIYLAIPVGAALIAAVVLYQLFLLVTGRYRAEDYS